MLVFTHLAFSAIMEEDNLPIISHAACEYTIDGFHINGQRREEGSLIRKLFLSQTTHGAKMFLVCRNFVFNQLQHYDIEYDTSEFAGSDVVQLKRDKSILVTRGQLDEVPPGRREMEKTMELQWLAALTPTQLSSDPELFVQKRFLDQFGALAPYKLDARKLVTVEYSSSQGDLEARLIEAVVQVEGLYVIGARSGPHQVFISRNENLVRAAARITEIRNARLLNLAQEKAEAEEHHKRLLELANIAADAEHRHSKLLDSDSYLPSPVGRYAVDSPTLNGVTCPGFAQTILLHLRRRERGLPAPPHLPSQLRLPCRQGRNDSLPQPAQPPRILPPEMGR